MHAKLEMLPLKKTTNNIMEALVKPCCGFCGFVGLWVCGFRVLRYERFDIKAWFLGCVTTNQGFFNIHISFMEGILIWKVWGR
jgi:hypothetical protein